MRLNYAALHSSSWHFSVSLYLEGCGTCFTVPRCYESLECVVILLQYWTVNQQQYSAAEYIRVHWTGEMNCDPPLHFTKLIHLFIFSFCSQLNVFFVFISFLMAENLLLLGFYFFSAFLPPFYVGLNFYIGGLAARICWYSQDRFWNYCDPDQNKAFIEVEWLSCAADSEKEAGPVSWRTDISANHPSEHAVDFTTERDSSRSTARALWGLTTASATSTISFFGPQYPKWHACHFPNGGFGWVCKDVCFLK